VRVVLSDDRVYVCISRKKNAQTWNRSLPGTRAMALHIMVEENAAMIITITIPNVVLQKKKNIKINMNINK
jgi:hypothetical protein